MPDTTLVECPWSERCAGCPLIDMPYEAQLAHKQEQLLASLHRYSTLASARVEPIAAASPIVGYRTRAKLMVASGPRVGLFEKGKNHEVVDIPGCPVLARGLDEAARALRALTSSPPKDCARALVPCDAGGALSAVDLRLVVDPKSGAEGVLVTLVLDRDRAPNDERMKEAAQAVRAAIPKALGIAVNLHAGGSPQVLGPATRVVWGAAAVPDRVGQVYQLASHGTFVQACRGQAETVYRFIEDGLRAHAGVSGARVIDVYGGSGAIGLALARAGADVTGIESFAPASENAKQAAEQQGLSADPTSGRRGGRFRARTGDAGEVLEGLAAQEARVDAVVLNPPRRGVDARARHAVARLMPKVALYVSCNPDTLARDLEHFGRLGLACKAIRPVDMIPLSEHVEAVALLLPAPPTPADIVHEDDAFLIAIKGPHEPSTPQPGHPVSLLDRVAAKRPGLRLVPLTSLEAGASGLVLIAKDPPRGGSKAQAMAAQVSCTHIVLVRGTVRPRGVLVAAGRGGKRERVAYERLERVGAHSIVSLTASGVGMEALRRALARLGHPVAGDDDAGHAPTNKHFEQRHGLDRPFWHCGGLELAPGRSVACPLWPDLDAAAASLRNTRSAISPGSGVSVADL
jgi:23S rRNA (uracil1939-C5)-methyltransferase